MQLLGWPRKNAKITAKFKAEIMIYGFFFEIFAFSLGPTAVYYTD